MTPDDILKTRFGFSKFRPGQREIIENLLCGQSVIATMPTGSGKSLCYQLPALFMSGVTLVISPLIALMKDQVDALKKINIPATFINSTLSWEETQRRFKGIERGEIPLVYIAPERFYSDSFLQLIKSVEVSLFIVDEAHCISQWGHDFRPSYLRLKDVIYTVGSPPVGAFTATATPNVRKDIRTHLDITDATEVVTGFDRSNLKYVARLLKNDAEKEEELLRILPPLNGTGIVYVGTKKLVSRIKNLLELGGFSVTGYHGGMEKAERETAQNDWINGRVKIIVATNAFGMGIDKPDVRFVIHYTMPGTVEAYYQESGRSGRDGKTAYCVSFSSYSDVLLQEFFIDNAHPPREIIIDVYDFLFSLKRNDIFLTHREIAAQLGGGVKEMMVGSTLGILERAGLVKRLSRSDHLMEIELIAQSNAAAQVKAETKQGILLNILKKRIPDPNLPTIRILPEKLAKSAGLTRTQLGATLLVLEKKELIRYTPPFRGRGVRLTSQKMQQSQLPIDFEAIEKHRNYQLQQLEMMQKYYSIRYCRRKYLLKYFGETYHSKNCRGCDVCLNWSPPGKTVNNSLALEKNTSVRESYKEINLKDLAADILQLVNDMNMKFGRDMLAKTLAGSQSKLLSPTLKMSPWYGKYEFLTRKFIAQVIEKLEEKDYLWRTQDIYPVLKLTPKGKAVLSEHKFPDNLKITPQKRNETKLKRQISGSINDQEQPFDRYLFEQLKSLRLVLAGGKPAFTVFSNQTLEIVNRILPTTMDEFASIPGVGPIKLKKYGRQFVALITQYLSGNRKSEN